MIARTRRAAPSESRWSMVTPSATAARSEAGCARDGPGSPGSGLSSGAVVEGDDEHDAVSANARPGKEPRGESNRVRTMFLDLHTSRTTDQQRYNHRIFRKPLSIHICAFGKPCVVVEPGAARRAGRTSELSLMGLRGLVLVSGCDDGGWHARGPGDPRDAHRGRSLAWGSPARKPCLQGHGAL